MRLQVRFGKEFLVGPAFETMMLMGISAPPDQKAEVDGRVSAVAQVHTSAPFFPCTSCLIESVPTLKLLDGFWMNAPIKRTRKAEPLQSSLVNPFGYGL
jgi:hypothetical protein